jgi:hypothetical protein
MGFFRVEMRLSQGVKTADVRQIANDRVNLLFFLPNHQPASLTQGVF